MSYIHISFDGGVRGSHRGGKLPGAFGVVVKEVQGSPTFADSATPFGFGSPLQSATNNSAEYAGMIAAVKVALYARVDQVLILADSKLVLMQVQLKWKCNHAHLKELRDTAMRLVAKLRTRPTLQHVPRAQNSEADAMCNQAMNSRGMVTMGASDAAKAAVDAVHKDVAELTGSLAPAVPPPVPATGLLDSSESESDDGIADEDLLAAADMVDTPHDLDNDASSTDVEIVAPRKKQRVT